MSDLPDYASMPTLSAKNSVIGDTYAEILPPMSPRPEDLKDQLLEQSNFLHGISNSINGPYKCSQQVAQLRPDTIYSLRPSQDVVIEDLYPANEFDAQYTHIGWPTLSTLPARPWDILNPGLQTSTSSSTWISRRMIIHKWKISIRIEDLLVLDPFVEAVETSLQHTTIAGQIQALRGIFAAWGDTIALSAVIGASLAATGSLPAGQNLAGNASSSQAPNRGPDIMQKIDQSLDITGNFDRRLESLIQGGSSEVFCQSGFDTWLTETVNINNSPTWEVVKVHRAVPITDLLSEPLRERINQLFSYANVVSRSPSVGSQTQFGFDGASLGVKDIKQIEVWHNGAVIQDISLVYVDNTSCGPHGFGKANPKSDTFVLARGEFITGVFIWHTSGSIASLQFIKNTSQLSALYGLQTGIGDPDVFTAGGCALLGLSGSFSSNTIVQAESVWRSDVEAKGYRSIATSFIGAGVNSTIFNDYRYLGDPSTARISQIRYRKTMAAIAGLQVTYTSTRGGNTVNHQTPLRGIEAGEQDTWTLTTGEYITQVQGKFKDGVVFQLEFLTNKGSARKFGKEEGEPFNFVPPDRNMVLYYMLGKSADLVQSLTFVWGTPPL